MVSPGDWVDVKVRPDAEAYWPGKVITVTQERTVVRFYKNNGEPLGDDANITNDRIFPRSS